MMQLFIEHASNLADVIIPFYQIPYFAPELIPLLLIQSIVFLCNRQQRVGDFCLRGIGCADILIDVDSNSFIDILLRVNSIIMKDALGSVNQVKVNFLVEAGFPVELLESLFDSLDWILSNYTTGRARFSPEICENGVTADGRGGDNGHISFSYSKAPKAKLTAALFAAKMYIWITAAAVAARRR